MTCYLCLLQMLCISTLHLTLCMLLSVVECVCVCQNKWWACVSVCRATCIFRCEQDEAGSNRHALGLDFREVLVARDHYAVHVGDSTPYQPRTVASAQKNNFHRQITKSIKIIPKFCLWWEQFVLSKMTWRKDSVSFSTRPANHLPHLL